MKPCCQTADFETSGSRSPFHEERELHRSKEALVLVQSKAGLMLVMLPLCSARVAFLLILTAALLGSLIVPSGNVRALRVLEMVVAIPSSRRWMYVAS